MTQEKSEHYFPNLE